MTGRRRRRDGLLTVIFWRDIPAQVVAAQGNHREAALLPERFQHAIDRAAGVAGLTETKAYVDQWRREEQQMEGDVASQVSALAGDLDARYSAEVLEQMVRSGGLLQHDDAAENSARMVNRYTT